MSFYESCLLTWVRKLLLIEMLMFALVTELRWRIYLVIDDLIQLKGENGSLYLIGLMSIFHPGHADSGVRKEVRPGLVGNARGLQGSGKKYINFLCLFRNSLNLWITQKRGWSYNFNQHIFWITYLECLKNKNCKQNPEN